MEIELLYALDLFKEEYIKKHRGVNFKLERKIRGKYIF